ncbi:DUF6158 family protein [Rugosimonospora acidiphila]|uniref:DUF6158 family protein n=1 Tax=Rugosimonospora acidiphila TaxID=556531 RepID=UPI003CD0A0B7
MSGTDLTDDDLLRELAELHRTRHQTLRHASDQALDRHDERTTELEAEYLRRFPEREVDPERVRSGARQRRAETIRPIEETQEVELAVGDEGPVRSLAEQGGAPPPFREPAPVSAAGPASGVGPRGGLARETSAEQRQSLPRGPAAARAAGASPDTGAARTGAEQPWDPEDLTVAQGHDPNRRNRENARQELAREGRSAIERTVP